MRSRGMSTTAQGRKAPCITPYNVRQPRRHNAVSCPGLTPRRVRRSPDCGQATPDGTTGPIRAGRAHTTVRRPGQLSSSGTAIFRPISNFWPCAAVPVLECSSRQTSQSRSVSRPVSQSVSQANQPCPYTHTPAHTAPTPHRCPSPGSLPLTTLSPKPPLHLHPTLQPAASAASLHPSLSSSPPHPEHSAPSLSPALSVLPPTYRSTPFLLSNPLLLAFSIVISSQPLQRPTPPASIPLSRLCYR
jgi:hypothetical protein